MEKWRTIKIYPKYEVSSTGRVRRISTGKILTEHTNSQGYPTVAIYPGHWSKPRVTAVHRLIALEFVRGDKSLTVNHKNGIKTDNIIENLEWITRAENASHAWRTGLTSALRGEACGKSKIKDRDVRRIRKLFKGGKTQSAIAPMFGLTQANVSEIVRYKTWKHI